MSTISVKLENIEELKPGLARTCKVNIKGMDTFYTPSRGIITSEANKHISITSNRVVNVPLDNPIFEIIADFKRELPGLYNRNGVFDKYLEKINSFARKFSGDMLLLFYPRWHSEYLPMKKDFDYLVDLQIFSELNYITIPEKSRDVSIKEFVDNLKQFQKKIENENITNTEKTTIPRISIRNKKDFNKKFDYIIERDSEYPICLIESGPYQHFTANYDYVISKCPENTLIHMYSTQRKKHGFNNSYSLPHWFQTKGFDSFTLFQPHGGGGSPNINEIPFLKEDDLRFIRTDERERQSTVCNCDYCQGLTLKKIINTDGVTRRGTRSYQKTFSAIKLHEIYLGTEEFITSQNRISDNDFIDYLKDKKLTDNDI